VQQRLGEALVDLLSQPAHMHVDDVGLRVEMIVPHIFEQHRARHHLAGVSHEEFEQAEFARQELDVLRAASHAARQQVHLEIADLELCGCSAAAAAPQQRLDARQQLSKGEGLGEIVVAAGAQASDPVVDRAQRAQDQHGGADFGAAERRHQRQPVHRRQHTVDDQRVVAAGTRHEQAGTPIGRVVDDIAALGEPLGDIGRRLAVVFDNEKLHTMADHSQPEVRGEGQGGTRVAPQLFLRQSDCVHVSRREGRAWL
jgi:hypothetical protein